MFYLGTSKIIAGPSAGKDCHFPFEYKGENYSTCITEDSQGLPWCSSTSNFSINAFGYCDCRMDGIYYAKTVITVNVLLLLL